jgi:hypothetical protein
MHNITDKLRDEAAILQWRTLEDHRSAQAKGRGYIFKEYHRAP